MDYVEVEGSSIDDAIARALQQLGAPRDRVEIEILANATRGLFGLGGRKAKVRATLRAPLSLETHAEPEPPPPPAPAPRPPRAAAQPKPAPRTPSAPPPARMNKAPAVVVEPALLTELCAALQEMVRLMGTAATVHAVQDPEGPRLVIADDESGILIGRRGQTLDAIEYVVNRMATRGEETGPHLVVDSQDYRARRRESLIEMAKRFADSARKRGKPVTLNPLNPRDRRVVHLALEGDPTLTTRSAGSGYYRKLIIIPAGARHSRPPRKES